MEWVAFNSKALARMSHEADQLAAATGRFSQAPSLAPSDAAAMKWLLTITANRSSGFAGDLAGFLEGQDVLLGAAFVPVLSVPLSSFQAGPPWPRIPLCPSSNLPGRALSQPFPGSKVAYSGGSWAELRGPTEMKWGVHSPPTRPWGY